MIAAVILLAMLTSCGKDASSYSDAKAVADAFGCSSFKHAKPPYGAADAGSCTFNGDRVEIVWSDDPKSLDHLVAMESADQNVLHGPNWAIPCGGTTDCRAIKKRIGGSYKMPEG